MTDIHPRLADALQRELDEHGYEDDDEKREQVAHHFADVLLTLPGIAIVELPESSYVDEPETDMVGYGFNGQSSDAHLAAEHGIYVCDGLIYDESNHFTPKEARTIASWWLAAARVAEGK